ncbi:MULTISPECIES: hypothetical protein [Moraxella]|uniref:Inhibitor I9 domain-containing protein n=1 Tax=Moraxella lacunata TaxID=477 RepID=A0A1B8PYG2_MORLA|nr:MULTISPECIES: hypothetical protein [Moraxella]MBE9578620.1 hypothetical protein [Moraxella sp. K1664]MBE9587921.1 hypothetical protein [Moraxella sp. K1630]MBE9589546.1 hypothetical protein [Moraxella sp. K127]MBE9596150.1 hypothetical protein [Moraxella sp. K2450]MDH9218495.1 hypothetical protein [Moraxella lacunata]
MRYLLLIPIITLTACVNTPYQSNNKIEQITQTVQSDVFIIYFDKDKKDNLLTHINHHHDEIIYLYQNMNAVAVKITATDLDKQIQSYQAIDGVLQITKNQTMQLH